MLFSGSPGGVLGYERFELRVVFTGQFVGPRSPHVLA
jgi:hypothetical protein